VILCGAQLGALQRDLQCSIVGVSAEGRGVFGDGAIVILPLLGELSGA